MIDGKNNSQADSTTPGHASADGWQVVDDLQAVLKNALRQHEQGGSLTVQEVLTQADALLGKARKGEARQVADVSLRELMQDYWQQVAARKLCAPTGLRGLNDALGGGLESESLVVLLGAPGAGKTAMANQIADHVANGGRPVLYVTSEDRPFSLLAKTLARIGDVNYKAVLKGWESERAKIDAAMATQLERQSSDTLRYVDANQGLRLDEVKTLAQAHFERYAKAGPGLLVIDYLQRFARAQRLLLGLTLDLRELVTMLTEQLRTLACDLDCCVVALGSQKRASGYGTSDALSSAKESGDIEYTADVLMALGEDKDRKTHASYASFLKPRLLRIDKNRQGETTTLQLDWQGDRQRFTDVEK
jgi:replicative DNA helicase